MNACAIDGLQLLDDVQQQIVEGEVISALRNLLRDLQTLRSAMAPLAWEAFAKGFFAGHSVRDYLHQSPLSRAAYQSGGEAVAAHWHGIEHRATMASQDCQHSFSNLIKNVSVGRQSLAQVIWAWERDLHACRSVRERLARMEAELDEVCQTVESARILRIDPANRWEIERLVKEPSASTVLPSTEHHEVAGHSFRGDGRPAVEWHFGSGGIQTQHCNANSLISACSLFGKFDYIYSTSLLENLSDADAGRLIQALSGLLKPNGRLLLANFTPATAESGYLEVCMGWRPEYRTEQQIATIAAQTLKCRLGQTVFSDDSGLSAFLEIQN